MTQEKLKQEIDKILSNPDTGKYEFRYSEAIYELIQEHIAEVIGKDQSPILEKLEWNRASLAEYGAHVNFIRNALRTQQRKRAGL